MERPHSSLSCPSQQFASCMCLTARALTLCINPSWKNVLLGCIKVLGLILFAMDLPWREVDPFHA